MQTWRVLAGLAAAGSALAGATRTAGAVVVMDPLVVEASHADWRLLTAPGFEVLSRCSRSDTDWFASGVFLSRVRERELPEGDLLPDLPAPTTVILYSAPPEEAGKLVPPPIEQTAAVGVWGNAPPPTEITGMIAGEDQDTISYALNAWGLQRKGVLQGYYGMSKQVERLTPPLPAWFAAALSGPFSIAECVASRSGWVHPSMLWVTPEETASAFAALERQTLSAAASANAAAPPEVVPLAPLLVRAGAHLVLLPMAEFFRERRAGERPPALWYAQAGLFARWGCYGESDDRDEAARRREGFHRLVERARSEPVTEPLVRECFGFGYEALRRKLTDYLHAAASEAVVSPFVQIHEWPAPLPRYRDRRATDGEVARVIGDWERMTGEQLRLRWPMLAARYFTEADKLLGRAFRRGERDPRLLAVYGLLQADVGNTPAAVDLLEQAVAQRVQRPAAYLMLARLRLEAAAERPLGAGGLLAPAQVAPLRSLLEGARRAGILPRSNYLFWAQVLGKAAADPAGRAGDLALLREGVRCYPRAVNLAAAAARLCRAWNSPAEAREFQRAALVFAPSMTAGNR